MTSKLTSTEIKQAAEEKNAKNVPDYIIHKGLRVLDPYVFEYTSFVKKRWIGSELYPLVCKEFKGETPEYYEKAILNGRISVNDEAKSLNYSLRSNDIIKHVCHRHEPPTYNCELKFIRLTNDVAVVDKPASLPVHPCGRFNHSSVVSRLNEEHQITGLKVVHRLDRLTSGVLILARNIKTAHTFEKQIKAREVSKIYFARVRGHFPDGIVDSHAKIKSISPRLGVCVVADDGKECHTKFSCLSKFLNENNEPESIVLCLPTTGRTHQIRVHLQDLHYPIVNDPLYAHKVWDDDSLLLDEKIKILCDEFAGTPFTYSDDDETNILKNELTNKQEEVKLAEQESVSTEGNDLNCNSNKRIKLENGDQNESKENKKNGGRQMLIRAKENGDLPAEVVERRLKHFDDNCTECQTLRVLPRTNDLLLFLHAYRYTGVGWEYNAFIPDWAKDLKEEVIDDRINQCKTGNK